MILVVSANVEPDRVTSFKSFDGLKNTKAEVGSLTAISLAVFVVDEYFDRIVYGEL